LLYKTTNLLNGRFYIGMHSTENPDDGYLGSGRRINAEIKKYGRENFKKEILEVLPSRDALIMREIEVVNETLRADPLCLNLKNGGKGGWDHCNNGSQKQLNDCARAGRIGGKTGGLIAGPKNGSANLKRLHSQGKIVYATFAGKTHLSDTRAKIKASMIGKQAGSKNSQFGSCWITDGVNPIKIKRDALHEYLSKGYHQGRK